MASGDRLVAPRVGSTFFPRKKPENVFWVVPSPVVLKLVVPAVPVLKAVQAVQAEAEVVSISVKAEF